MLARGGLGDRDERRVGSGLTRDRHQLVHEAGGRRTRPGDHRCADAVDVDRVHSQSCDAVLVQVTRDHDAGAHRTQRVEQRTGARHLIERVAAVEADRAQVGAGDRHGIADPLLGVVGVDEQSGARAERAHLCCEGVALLDVRQREGMCAGAGRRHPVPPPRFEVGRHREAGDVRRPRRGHRCLLVGASPAHLQQRPAPRREHHAGGS